MKNSEISSAGLIKIASGRLEDDSSYLGRLLAARSIPEAIASNKQEIMRELDPSGDYTRDHLFLSRDMMKKQQQMAYDKVEDLIKRRSAAGGYIKNALLFGLLGGATGGALSLINDDVNPLFMAGIGAGAGSLAGVGVRAYEGLRKKIVTERDIARMKEKTKDHGYRQLIPGRSLVDAALA